MTKDKCNELYENLIYAMEDNQKIEDIHALIIEVAQSLLELGKHDPLLTSKCNQKASMLINLSKDIRISKSYKEAYKKLTGKELIIKELPAEKEIENIINGSSKLDEEVIPHEIDSRKEEKENHKKEFKKETIGETSSKYKYNWNNIPETTFADVAGLDNVKEEVKKKVLMPLLHPELYDGYLKQNGGGLLLFGPPGTGKTMIAAAIANEIGAKFCSIGPSDVLTTGVGNSEKAIAELFKEARSFKCAVIFFDEIESLCPVSTHAQHARQIRSELLRQMQGLDSYSKDTGNILYLIAATNKPWDIDPAFVRPGRFGTRVYVGLPDDNARLYMIQNKLNKINLIGKVQICDNLNYNEILVKTKDFNGADMTYLLDEVQQISIDRTVETNEKLICNDDFIKALEKVVSSVQSKDIEKINEWKELNLK